MRRIVIVATLALGLTIGTGLLLLRIVGAPAGRATPPQPVAILTPNEPSPPLIRPPWRMKESTSRARIYVDASASIRGYIRQEPDHYSKFLRRLKGVLVDRGILEYEWVPFGLRPLDRN